MPAKIVFSEDQKAGIIKDYLAEMPFEKLEAKYNICAPAIRKYLKLWSVHGTRSRRGIKGERRKDLSKEEIEIAVSAYKSGEQIPQIAKRIGIRPISLSLVLKQMGLFQKRRNKEYKHAVTDEQIVQTFAKEGSIRKTSKKLFGINPKYIKDVLERSKIEDITHKEIYERLEPHRDEIISAYLSKTSPLPTISEKYGVTKHILRMLFKKWGVYDKALRPKMALIKAEVSEKDVLNEYERVKTIRETSENLRVSQNVVRKILKAAKANDYLHEKYAKIEADKEDIIRDYLAGQSSGVIAKRYGVWMSTVLDYLKKWGVQPVNFNYRRIGFLMAQNKNDIIDLYVNKSYSLREIAEKYDVGHQTVIRSMKRWKIVIPDNRMTESSLERKFKKILVTLGIEFSQYFKIAGRIYDFYLPQTNTLIECNGDYWHGNPLKFKILNEEQKKGWARDVFKKCLAEKHGYRIYFIWEHEVNEKPDEVAKIMEFICSLDRDANQGSAIDFLTDKGFLLTSRANPLGWPVT